MSRELISTVPKNNGDEVRVFLRTDRAGNLLCEITLFELISKHTKLMSASKGISIPAALLPELTAALQQAAIGAAERRAA